MTRSCFALALALTAGFWLATPSVGQHPDGPCAGVTGTPDEFNSQIGQLRLRVDSLRAAPGESSKPEIAQREAQIAELVFKHECARTDLDPDPVRGLGQPQPQWITVSTYYGTNRKPVGATGAITRYGADREGGDAIRYGQVRVSIPTRRKAGELNLPLDLWVFEMPADPSKHFVIRSVAPLAPTAAIQQMQTRLGKLSKKSILLFVHGYNVPFEDAALRTAQLAHDLDFPGMPIFFSWPSLGRPQGYARDEEMSELSVASLNRLLDRLSSLGASEIFIVAHSMGNRVVTRALQERASTGKPIPTNLKGILLAAPDINVEIFKEKLAPALAGLGGISRTIYASSGDAALRASSFIHDFKRVGETRDGVLVFDGFDTVDASLAAPVRRGFGHSYVVDSPKVIRDMQAIMLLKKPAHQRGLAKKGTPPRFYWNIP
jgi:esterase/lipase superfamily enzyme